MARVLMVEDQDTIRFAVSSYLRARGHTVFAAACPADARELIDEHLFDVAMTDLRFNGSDEREGLGLAEELRQRFPRLPIFVVTAYGSTELVAWAEKLGLNALLSKPLRLHELERHFEAALSQLSVAPTAGGVEADG